MTVNGPAHAKVVIAMRLTANPPCDGVRPDMGRVSLGTDHTPYYPKIWTVRERQP
jgi:hypothetical protein